MGSSKHKRAFEIDCQTVPQVARRLECSADTVWRWIRRGDLKAVRLPGRLVRVSQTDLEAFIKRARVEQ